MKVTIEIDCTPLEARQAMGLPDVGPMQEKWLAQIEEKMLASVQSFSPEGLAQKWLLGAPSTLTGLGDTFLSLAGKAMGSPDARK